MFNNLKACRVIRRENKVIYYNDACLCLTLPSFCWTVACKKKTCIDSLYQDSDAKISVMERAEEVLQSIPIKYPRFSKSMITSNVSQSFGR